MADKYNFARCTQAREDLEKLHKERNRQRVRISQLEQRLDIRRGEIAQAENTLSRLEEAIRHARDGAIAMAVDILSRDIPGLVRDGVLTAIQLANTQAR